MFALLFFVILLYWYQIKDRGNKAKSNYNLIIALLLFLMSGLRHEAIYGDTIRYVASFLKLENMSLQDIVYEHPKDSFFYIASHYLHPFLFHNYTLWLLLIAIIYTFPMYKLVRNYSVNPMWSWLCFIFLGLFTFGMAGIRQAVAMGFCMNAFLSLVKGDWKKFFLFVAIAYLFHGTALIFLLVFPFTKVKFAFNKTAILLYALTTIIIVLYGTTILANITESLGASDERFISYGEDMRGATYGYLLQQVVLVLPSLYILRKKYKEPLVALFSHLSIIALIFIVLSPVIAEMFRVSMYFSWANMILFPMALKEASRKDSTFPVLYMGFFIFYMVFFSKIVLTDYYFWFQDASAITVFLK